MRHSHLILSSLLVFTPIAAANAAGEPAPAAGPAAAPVAAESAVAAVAAPEFPRFSLANTQLRALPRSANDREYLLYVALPESYASEPQRRYPVLYLCDGYYDFGLVTGFYGNLIYDKVVPEFIIVGFGYPGEKPDYDALRRYDYTPVPDPDTDPKAEKSGHAPQFLSVVEKEIIPFIEREYRADPKYRVLGGSSLGGLFTIYALYARPGLFQTYLAPSPAAGWAHDWLFEFERNFGASGRKLDARLFMTGASEEWPEFLDAIKRFDAQLEKRGYQGLTLEWRLIDGERHAGTKAESYNRGIRYAFAPLLPPAPAK